ncbi:MAG: adenosine deaminase [Fluviicola sp.]|jgi:adenosine deaminase
MTIATFIEKIPKAELHVHIEGTFEPELMFEIAKRNRIEIPYKSVDEIRDAYEFSNLQDFLDIYYAGAGVLQTEEDFYDLTWHYLKRCQEQNVVHTEIFFDPQTHTDRGVSFETVVSGIHRALEDGKQQLGVNSLLIMCFLRHLDEDSAFKTLESAISHKDKIIGVGLDSSEVGHPPSKFQRVFEKARNEGFLTVAHAGEEGPAEYVWEALDLLLVSRVDHGNNSLNDTKLTQLLADKRMPLTVCPLSNFKLQVVPNLDLHPIRRMLDLGLCATINSDDPAYFGGYMNENYLALEKHLKLTKDEIVTLTKNAFEASFVSSEIKQVFMEKVEQFAQQELD